MKLASAEAANGTARVQGLCVALWEVREDSYGKAFRQVLCVESYTNTFQKQKFWIRFEPSKLLIVRGIPQNRCTYFAIRPASLAVKASVAYESLSNWDA